MLEAVQRGIERPLLDSQQVAGNLLDSLGDDYRRYRERVPMLIPFTRHKRAQPRLNIGS